MSSEPDRNQVYGLSNTMSEFLQTTHNILTVGSLQLVLSIQTPEFEAILDQRVKDQMTHFVSDYEWLSAETAELCQIVMEIRSQMDDTCAPSYLASWSRQRLSFSSSSSACILY